MTALVKTALEVAHAVHEWAAVELHGKGRAIKWSDVTFALQMEDGGVVTDVTHGLVNRAFAATHAVRVVHGSDGGRMRVIGVARIDKSVVIDGVHQLVLSDEDARDCYTTSKPPERETATSAVVATDCKYKDLSTVAAALARISDDISKSGRVARDVHRPLHLAEAVKNGKLPYEEVYELLGSRDPRPYIAAFAANVAASPQFLQTAIVALQMLGHMYAERAVLDEWCLLNEIIADTRAGNKSLSAFIAVLDDANAMMAQFVNAVVPPFELLDVCAARLVHESFYAMAHRNGGTRGIKLVILAAPALDSMLRLHAPCATCGVGSACGLLHPHIIAWPFPADQRQSVSVLSTDDVRVIEANKLMNKFSVEVLQRVSTQSDGGRGVFTAQYADAVYGIGDLYECHCRSILGNASLCPRCVMLRRDTNVPDMTAVVRSFVDDHGLAGKLALSRTAHIVRNAITRIVSGARLGTILSETLEQSLRVTTEVTAAAAAAAAALTPHSPYTAHDITRDIGPFAPPCIFKIITECANPVTSFRHPNDRERLVVASFLLSVVQGNSDTFWSLWRQLFYKHRDRAIATSEDVFRKSVYGRKCADRHVRQWHASMRWSCTGTMGGGICPLVALENETDRDLAARVTDIEDLRATPYRSSAHPLAMIAEARALSAKWPAQNFANFMCAGVVRNIAARHGSSSDCGIVYAPYSAYKTVKMAIENTKLVKRP